MPARRCPYCKVVSNFSLGGVVGGGKMQGLASLDQCHNCGTHTYFVTQSQNKRDTVLDSYPKLEVDPDEELPEDVKVAFREAIKALNEEIWNGCVTMCRRALEEARRI